MLVDFNELFERAANTRFDGQPTRAIEQYLEIVQLATTPEELSFKAQAWHLAGVTTAELVSDQSSSTYRDGLQYFTQASQLYAQLPTINLGTLNADWAVLHDEAKAFTRAWPYFQQALEIFGRASDEKNIATTWSKIGHHFYLLNQLPEAASYLSKALNTLQKWPEAGLDTALTFTASAFLTAKMTNWEEALEPARTALGWFEADHGDRHFYLDQTRLNGLMSIIFSQITETKAARQAAAKFARLRQFVEAPAIAKIDRDLNFVLGT